MEARSSMGKRERKIALESMLGALEATDVLGTILYTTTTTRVDGLTLRTMGNRGRRRA